MSAWPIEIHTDLVETYKVNSAATLAMIHQIGIICGCCELSTDYDGWRCSAKGIDTSFANNAHEAVKGAYEAACKLLTD